MKIRLHNCMQSILPLWILPLSLLFTVKDFAQGNLIPPSPVTINFWRNVTYSNVSLNSGGNAALVPPGATVTLSFNYSTWTTDPNAYCPGCKIQWYYGITNTFSNCFFSNGIPINFPPQNGTVSGISFTAPTTPGVYYITQSQSLAMACNVGGWAQPSTYNLAFAVVIVTGPVWINNGNSIYYNAGNVGIGTNMPTQALDVAGSIAVGGNPVINPQGKWVGDTSGLRGPQGVPGTPGTPGTPGVNGSKWWAGNGVPSASLGANSDLYIDTPVSNLYQKNASAWVLINTLKGSPGAPGAPGANGSRWYTGAGAPAQTLGVSNDLFLDTIVSFVYQKSATIWVQTAYIRGGAGTPGVNGSKWYTGSGSPVAATGVAGDLFLDTVASGIYQKTVSGWNAVGNIKGTTGSPGSPGTPGANGAKWFTGGGVPTSALGVTGDLYLDTTASNVYQKGGAGWTFVNNIKGAPGNSGQATRWYIGIGAPASSTGANGDLYLDTASSNVYLKTGTAWAIILNIKGPQGNQGSQGDKGDKGDKGDTGSDGSCSIISCTAAAAAAGGTAGTAAGTIAGEAAGTTAGTAAGEAAGTTAGETAGTTAGRNAAEEYLNQQSAGGDVSGKFSSLSVVKIQGKSVSSSSPTTDQLLGWNGSSWTPVDKPAYKAGSGLSLNDKTFNADSARAIWNAGQLQGKAIASTAPSNGQVLKWNGSNWTPSADNNSTYRAGAALKLIDSTFSAKYDSATWNANQLQGNTLSKTSPQTGQVLKWDGSNWSPGVDSNTRYRAGAGLLLKDSIFLAKLDSALWNASKLMGVALSDSAPKPGQVLTYTNNKWQPSNGSAECVWKVDSTKKDSMKIFPRYKGWVGIGTNTPKALFHVQGDSTGDQFIVTNRGIVGIGTLTPSSQYKLSVNGSIHAKKVVVESGWADYVFAAGYRRMSLDKLDRYIKDNAHLPGMPTTGEVQAGGLDIGVAQTKMLEKIEELTLYVLELKKGQDRVQAENRELKKQVKILQTPKSH